MGVETSGHQPKKIEDIVAGTNAIATLSVANDKNVATAAVVATTLGIVVSDYGQLPLQHQVTSLQKMWQLLLEHQGALRQ